MVTSLALRLRQARTQKGLSQEQVAHAIGATRGTITRWERGTVIPTPYYRQGLCRLFQLNPETLFSVDTQELTSHTSSDLMEDEQLPDDQILHLAQRFEQHNPHHYSQSAPATFPDDLSGALSSLLRFQLQEKYLDLQIKYLQYLPQAIDILITHLEPQCDPDTRALTERLLLLQFHAQENTWQLPTAYLVKTVLDQAREQIQTQQKALALQDFSLDDLRKALDHLDDINFLQQCSLSQSPYILSQIHDDTSSVQRSQFVRDFLKTAFEQLRPSGIRSDTATEWRNYNILYYRYFKHHLVSEQIAARLGISRRQFFREQEHALRALLLILLELNHAS